MFEKIKRFFNLKLYTKKQIRQFCDKGVITPEQYSRSPEKTTNMSEVYYERVKATATDSILVKSNRST